MITVLAYGQGCYIPGILIFIFGQFFAKIIKANLAPSRSH